MVESNAVEHLTHIKTNFFVGTISSLADLPEHRIVINVDFDQWKEFTVDISKIAICTIIWTAVRNRHKFIIGMASDIFAEPTVKVPHKRGGLSDHQSSFTCQ